MDIDTIKIRLKEKGISIRSIARDLKASHATVKAVLDNTFIGTENRKHTILKHIENLLSDREDLNSLIYDNIDILYDTMLIAIKSAKLKNEQLDRLIPIYQKFSQLKKAKQQNEE